MKTSNRVRVEDVFADLEKRGVIARADFWCCNSCASAALLNRELPSYKERAGAENQPVGYVFFHEQATDSANDGAALYLAHGSISEIDVLDEDRVENDQLMVAQIVIEVFREHGFETEWNGNTASKILVLKPEGGWNLNYDRYEDEDED